MTKLDELRKKMREAIRLNDYSAWEMAALPHKVAALLDALDAKDKLIDELGEALKGARGFLFPGSYRNDCDAALASLKKHRGE